MVEFKIKIRIFFLIVTLLKFFPVQPVNAQQGLLVLKKGSVKVIGPERTSLLRKSGAKIILKARDRVQTGRDTVAKIRIKGKSEIIELKSRAFFRMGKISRNTSSISLLTGKARFQILGKPVKNNKRKRFQIRTVTALIGVRGTDFVVGASNTQTSLLTISGTVSVAPVSMPDIEIDVPANQASKVQQNSTPTQPVELSPSMRTKILKDDSPKAFNNVKFGKVVDPEKVRKENEKKKKEEKEKSNEDDGSKKEGESEEGEDESQPGEENDKKDRGDDENEGSEETQTDEDENTSPNPNGNSGSEESEDSDTSLIEQENEEGENPEGSFQPRNDQNPSDSNFESEEGEGISSEIGMPKNDGDFAEGFGGDEDFGSGFGGDDFEGTFGGDGAFDGAEYSEDSFEDFGADDLGTGENLGDTNFAENDDILLDESFDEENIDSSEDYDGEEIDSAEGIGTEELDSSDDFIEDDYGTDEFEGDTFDNILVETDTILDDLDDALEEIETSRQVLIQINYD